LLAALAIVGALISLATSGPLQLESCSFALGRPSREESASSATPEDGPSAGAETNAETKETIPSDRARPSPPVVPAARLGRLAVAPSFGELAPAANDAAAWAGFCARL